MPTVSLSLPFQGQYTVTQPYGVTRNTFEPSGHGYGPTAANGYRDDGLRWHQGIDWPLPDGTQLYAAGDGTVYDNQYERGYGFNAVYIDHGQGVTSLCGHMSRKDVTDGTQVKRGDPIGLSGGGTGNAAADGNSTGAHLHFGVLLDGFHDQDPSLYLTGQGPVGSAAGASVPATLTPEQAVYYARAAGLPESQLATAVSIAMAESGLSVAAHNHNAPNPNGGDPCARRGSDDWGIWQVNTCYNPTYNQQQLTTDPLYNAQAMVALSHNGARWAGTWSSYPASSNTYLPRAQAAVAATPPGTVPPGLDASGASYTPYSTPSSTAGSADNNVTSVVGNDPTATPADTTPQQPVSRIYIEPVTVRFDLCYPPPRTDTRRRGWLPTCAVKLAGYWLPVVDCTVNATQYLIPGRASATLALDDVRRRAGNAIEQALYEQGWQQITVAMGYAPPKVVNGQSVPDLAAIGGPDTLPKMFTGIVNQQRPSHKAAQRRIALSAVDLSLIASDPSATNSAFSSTAVNQSGYELVKALWLAHNPVGYSGLTIKGRALSGATVGGLFGTNTIQTRQSGRTEWAAMVQAAQQEGATLYMDGSTLVYGPIPAPGPALTLAYEKAGQPAGPLIGVDPTVQPHSKRDYQVVVNSFQTGDGSIETATGGNHDATTSATIWEHANVAPDNLQSKADYYANLYAAVEKMLTLTMAHPVGVSRGQPIVIDSDTLYTGFTDPGRPYYTSGIQYDYKSGAGLTQIITATSRPLAVLGTEQASSLGGGF